MLPNFLCIGAQKAGTTTISMVLERLPGVFMARPRETRFFVDETQYARGLPYYEVNAFAGWNGEAAIGEKTPEYLLWDDTPARVRAMLGTGVRLIVTLRNPAQRAFSHYRQMHQMCAECLPFADALAAEETRVAGGRIHEALFGYRRRGCYARLLAPWFAQFPRENFLILHFERDLVRHGQDLSDRLCAFLGLPPIGAREEPPKAGRPELPEWSTDAHTVTLATARGRTTIREPSPQLRAFAAAAAAVRPDATALSAEQARDLNRRLWRAEIEAAAELTGLELREWLD